MVEWEDASLCASTADELEQGLRLIANGKRQRSEKHLKTNERSHLSAETVKMQSTLHGAACVEHGRERRKEAERSGEVWSDVDVAFEMGLENWRKASMPDPSIVPQRLFRAWIEDWEEESIYTKNPEHEARLLAKYGGLHFHDPDKQQCTSPH